MHTAGRPSLPQPAPGPFGWFRTAARVDEAVVVKQAGLDAVVFLRFTRTVRNIFAILTLIACATFVPANVLSAPTPSTRGVSLLSRLTPLYSRQSSVFWAYVGAAYLFDLVVCLFLWCDYRAIARLKAAYLRTPGYQAAIHARTLLFSDVPSPLRSDTAMSQLTDAGYGALIGRDVGDLKALVKEYDRLLHELGREDNPARDRTDLVADIDRKREEIREVRRLWKDRKPHSYGFATYPTVQVAHHMAQRYRRLGPEGTAVRFAVQPSCFIWRNLNRSRAYRRWRRRVNGFCIALLTLAWIAPNVFIAVFVANLSHLALVWPAFRATLHAHPTIWAVVQGILPPALISLFYYFLPAIFRRFATNAGDLTKPSRERHVMRNLFSFYLFNQLFAFSLFSAIWALGAALIHVRRGTPAAWDAVMGGKPFEQLVRTLITVSPYWCCWLLQRNLGTSIHSVISTRTSTQVYIRLRSSTFVHPPSFIQLRSSAFVHPPSFIHLVHPPPPLVHPPISPPSLVDPSFRAYIAR